MKKLSLLIFLAGFLRLANETTLEFLVNRLVGPKPHSGYSTGTWYLPSALPGGMNSWERITGKMADGSNFK